MLGELSLGELGLGLAGDWCSHGAGGAAGVVGSVVKGRFRARRATRVLEWRERGWGGA